MHFVVHSSIKEFFSTDSSQVVPTLSLTQVPCQIFGLYNVIFLDVDHKHLYKACILYLYCTVMIL